MPLDMIYVHIKTLYSKTAIFYFKTQVVSLTFLSNCHLVVYVHNRHDCRGVIVGPPGSYQCYYKKFEKIFHTGYRNFLTYIHVTNDRRVSVGMLLS